MSVQSGRAVDGIAPALDGRGFVVRPHVVPAPLVAALREATDRSVAAEAPFFPAGDEQHGRVLFAPAHGGAFLDLCAFDPLFEPIEALLGSDAIVYTMTTSVLAPGTAGPVHRYHVDLPADRPAGEALTAMLLLDRFDAESGPTEFLPGSHRWGDTLVDDDQHGELIAGAPGDVCYFDPRIRHRSTTNRSERPRRALLVQLVRPWMKQRFDVRSMVDTAAVESLGPVARRRLGFDALPPRDRSEFIQRRERRPWS